MYVSLYDVVLCWALFCNHVTYHIISLLIDTWIRLFQKLCAFSPLCQGLKVNYAKSSFIPLNVAEVDQAWVKSVLGCTQTSFPTTYLGMPLSVKKPSKQLYIPLIEKIERRLQGWHSKLLSRGGRFVLAQTIRSTIPIYHMICFVLTKWVIYDMLHKIDQEWNIEKLCTVQNL